MADSPASSSAAPSSPKDPSEPKRGRTAAKPKDSYSLYTESGKKLKSGVSREEAAEAKTKRKNEEGKNSILQAD
jgi:hypothetical protein